TRDEGRSKWAGQPAPGRYRFTAWCRTTSATAALIITTDPRSSTARPRARVIAHSTPTAQSTAAITPPANHAASAATITPTAISAGRPEALPTRTGDDSTGISATRS